MEGISGTWRWVGCDDSVSSACTPQRVSRWRYISEDRPEQSADKLLTKPKIYTGTVTKVVIENDRAVGVQFLDEKGQQFMLRAQKEVILAAGTVNTPKVQQLLNRGREVCLFVAGISSHI